jgi:hypothetical protein
MAVIEDNIKTIFDDNPFFRLSQEAFKNEYRSEPDEIYLALCAIAFELYQIRKGNLNVDVRNI